MIYQVVLIGGLLALACGYPQTFQYQRQVYFNPPVPALHHHGIVPSRQFIQEQPTEFIPRGTLNQPFVYVYSPEGESGSASTGQVFVLRQNGEDNNSWTNFFGNALGVIQSYFPPIPGLTPASEKPPTETTSSAEATGNSSEEKQPDAQDEGPIDASAETFAPEGNAAAPAPAEPQRQRFFVLGPQAAQFVGGPNQFLFRSLQDGVINRAGEAAIDFQRQLALAKQKKVRGQQKESQGAVDPEGVVAVEAVHKESSEESSTEAESSETVENAEQAGPSIAQAKPQAVSVAGPGGVAAAAPIGTAVVGPGGMALSAPSATAIAGAKGPKHGSPAKLKAYFKQANLPGYFVQY